MRARDKDRCGEEGNYVVPVGFHMATGYPPPLRTPWSQEGFCTYKINRVKSPSSIERFLVSPFTRKESPRRSSAKHSTTNKNTDRQILTMQPMYTIIFLATIFLFGKCYSHPTIRQREMKPSCVGCGDECNKCKYGVTISTLCGIEECRRGPGDICGGPSQAWGVCGDGLICSCNRCAGCSLDSLACYTHLCLPHQNLEQRGHLEIIDRFPIAN